MNELKRIEPFKFWCQTVMPTVYDDSLSYYELLNKVASKLNDVINACNDTGGNVTELVSLFNELNDYVMNYFANLDVQNEINAKLDEMVLNGSFDRILSKFFGVFITPQMYGAKGDGVTDDTVAINTCLAENKFVFIPSGVYLVSDTIKLNTSVKNTVMCTSTTRIQASRALRPVLMIGNDDGFNAMYFSWDGGVIDCGGFDDCVGVRFTQHSTASCVDNMVVENFGKNSVGVGICDDLTENFPSIQLNIGRLRIKDYVSSTKPNVINTGVVIKAYDLEISSLYVYGCTVGIDCVGGSLIHINDYHYWVGNNDNVQFTADTYLKTIALKNDGSLNFDLFYSDQAYIAVSGGHMTANYSHIIAINPKDVDTNGAVNAYVVELTSNYKDVDFGTVTINKNGNDNVHAIKNKIGMPLYRFVNDRPVTAKYKYETESVPQASILFNICNEPSQHCFLSGGDIIADKWYKIGYVPKTNGNYQILINSSSNQCQAKADVDVTSYSCVIRRAGKMLSNVGDISFSVSKNTTEIDGYQFYTLYVKFSESYSSATRLFSNTTGVGGFYRCELGTAIDDSEIDDVRTVTCYNINDSIIKTITATTPNVTIHTGYNRVTLTDIPQPPNQYYFANIVTKMYSNKSPLNVVLSLYHSDNTVDVYSTNEYTDVEITVEYEYTIRQSYM